VETTQLVFAVSDCSWTGMLHQQAAAVDVSGPLSRTACCLCALLELLLMRVLFIPACLPLCPRQVAAATVCCAFINSLEDAREREVFQPLLLPILASLVRGWGGRTLSVGSD
jgi:hypothetical protein